MKINKINLHLINKRVPEQIYNVGNISLNFNYFHFRKPLLLPDKPELIFKLNNHISSLFPSGIFVSFEKKKKPEKSTNQN